MASASPSQMTSHQRLSVASSRWTTARRPYCMFTSRGFEAARNLSVMMNPRRYFLIGGCLGLMALTAATIHSAYAQEDPSKYPTRAIHIVVGFTPGRGNHTTL